MAKPNKHMTVDEKLNKAFKMKKIDNSFPAYAIIVQGRKERIDKAFKQLNEKPNIKAKKSR